MRLDGECMGEIRAKYARPECFKIVIQKWGERRRLGSSKSKLCPRKGKAWACLGSLKIPLSDWYLVGNEGTTPHYRYLRIHSLIPY